MDDDDDDDAARGASRRRRAIEVVCARSASPAKLPASAGANAPFGSSPSPLRGAADDGFAASASVRLPSGMRLRSASSSVAPTIRVGDDSDGVVMGVVSGAAAAAAAATGRVLSEADNAARMLMFDAGATAASEAADAAAGSRRASASAPASHDFVADFERAVQQQQKESSAASSASYAVDDDDDATASSADPRRRSSRRAVNHAAVANHMALLDVNDRVAALQRRYRHGAVVGGGEVIDLATTLIALVDMWEYKE